MDLIELTDDRLPGPVEAYVARPEGDGPYPGVLFSMDALGVRPRIAEMADRIASWGYVVLAPNLFHRAGSAAETSPDGPLTAESRSAFFEGAMTRVGQLTPELTRNDAPAYVDALLGLDGAADGPVGVTGYCMGVRFALRTAGLLPDRVAALGGFHGGGLVTEDDESPHLSLATARAEMVFGHADHDRSMPPEAVSRLGEALDEAGLAASNQVYDGAAHGYTMSDTEAYDEQATERHFDALREVLQRTLPTAAAR